jgi:hypothetical protein
LHMEKYSTPQAMLEVGKDYLINRHGFFILSALFIKLILTKWMKIVSTGGVNVPCLYPGGLGLSIPPVTLMPRM